MNLRELARLAGVSVSTVSKAFHNADDVSEKTKTYIFDIAKQYGCFEKYHLDRFGKRIFAVICPELRSYYYADAVDRLQQVIEADGGLVLISTDGFNRKKQAELVEYYAAYLHVDGIFVYGYSGTAATETPIISISGGSASVDSVVSDLSEPMQQAVAHLQSLNHTRIAFIGDRLTQSKAALFQAAMDASSLPVPETYLVESADRFERAGEDGMTRLLALPTPPTAVICAYDYIACGAISHLTRSGLRVPEDVSVIGMDNINASQHMDPALTSIDSGWEQVSRIAWDLMKKKLEDPSYRLRQKIMLTGQLILRETTAKAKA